METLIEKLFDWIGQWHLLFLHFPIALIIMVGVAEVLFKITKNPLFGNAALFMLVAVVIMTVPTVFTGLAFAEGTKSLLLPWHRFFGLTTFVLSCITLYLHKQSRVFYGVCLALLIVSVTVTGYLGGMMSFSDWHLF